ncbi:MAG: hypothetical protein JJU34_09035 [Lunatimonas sp.]|uniref:sensor histidine kinase n=1 Tax=Lunatimonas sp. TaxID=2060141 RepID=UPI00263A9DEE|nr:ATP-binding protein [Lunatimonas sp.]MCC5937413.1 hypothetical protein [Lunatimonas sp.]
MERIKTYTFITLSFIVLCGGISIYTIYRINFLQRSNQVHEKVLALANSINSSVLENEITMLSYATTFDSLFLDSLEVIYRKIHTNLETLEAFFPEYDLEESRIDSIRLLLDERVVYFKSSLQDYGSPEEYLPYIIENRKKNYLRIGKRIKAQTDAIVQRQQEQIKERETGVSVNLTTLSAVIFVITLIGIITAFLNFISISKYYHAQQAATNEIRSYQEKLKLQIDQLNQTNHELEQFAYVASHDLQEPLRKITAFNDLLQDQYKDSIEGEGKLYLDRMAHAAKRMRRLITDLLEYSRAGRYSEEREQLKLSELLGEVIEDLSLQIEESGATITQKDLPTLFGHYNDWRMVFQNLISNALKFRKDGVPPTIQITCEPASPELLREKLFNYSEAKPYFHIRVSDNGIGFKSDYAEKIFTIFQRLHGKDEYEGTGIGLAICKKIMERYEGTIFATSEVNEGSTFHLLFSKV